MNKKILRLEVTLHCSFENGDGVVMKAVDVTAADEVVPSWNVESQLRAINRAVREVALKNRVFGINHVYLRTTSLDVIDATDQG